MRTTIDIDDPILQKLKQVAHDTGLPLGRVVSDLLAEALHAERAKKRLGAPKPSRSITKPMRALVDIDHMDAVLDAVDAADGKLQGRPAGTKKTRR